jgi:hypothetical protein
VQRRRDDSAVGPLVFAVFAVFVGLLTGPTRGAEALRDPEVEQLGEQPAPALDHHDVRGLEVTMHDAALVGGVHHIGDVLEERNELRQGHRPSRLQVRAERDAVDALHRDPLHTIVLDAERIHVRGERVFELRGQPRLAPEALHPIVAPRPRAPHLDDGVPPELPLLAAVHDAVAAAADRLAHQELPQGSTRKLEVRHSFGRDVYTSHALPRAPMTVKQTLSHRPRPVRARG